MESDAPRGGEAPSRAVHGFMGRGGRGGGPFEAPKGVDVNKEQGMPTRRRGRPPEGIHGFNYRSFRGTRVLHTHPSKPETPQTHRRPFRRPHRRRRVSPTPRAQEEYHEPVKLQAISLSPSPAGL
jgi:hypothetical protein